MAGILIKVGTDIIDWDYLKGIKHAPKAGVVIMSTVFGIIVFVDLIIAVGVGMVMASLLFLKRTTDLQIESICAGYGPPCLSGKRQSQSKGLFQKAGCSATAEQRKYL